MTTPSRTVTPLYDQALEGMLDGEVTCLVTTCGATATHALTTPCGCISGSPMCRPHVENDLAVYHARSGRVMDVAGHEYAYQDITIRPI